MHFENPIWLYVIPLVWAVLIFVAWASGKRRKQVISNFAASRLLNSLTQSYSPRKQRFKQVLLLLAVAFALAALARPQWGYHWRETKSKGIDILFALDASKSMLATI